MLPRNINHGLLWSILLFGLHGLAAHPVASMDSTAGWPAGRFDPDSTAPERIMLSKRLHLAGGQLTLPFKIRPQPSYRSFLLTTDVTIGGYVGVSRRLFPNHDCYLTVPLTAGLTFVNLNEQNTSLDLATDDPGIVPGLTWSTGFIFQLGDCNLGLVCGQDFASAVGNQWDYHGKWWWSFAIGYTFLN